jgi:hypothetical protein
MITMILISILPLAGRKSFALAFVSIALRHGHRVQVGDPTP